MSDEEIVMNLVWMLIVRAIVVALTALSVKLKLPVGEVELESAATWIAGIGVVVLSVAAERYAPKLWAKIRGTPPAAPLLIVAVLAVGLSGCSNLTPQQRFNLQEAAYIAGNVGVSAAYAAGKVPESALPAIQKDFATAAERLNAAQEWLDAHPDLANVVGTYVPELDAFQTAVRIARNHLRRFVLIAPLPSRAPPGLPPPSSKSETGATIQP